MTVVSEAFGFFDDCLYFYEYILVLVYVKIFSIKHCCLSGRCQSQSQDKVVSVRQCP